MKWVGIIGAKGYVSEAITRLIAGHPEAQISKVVNSTGYSVEKGSIDYRNMLDVIEKSDIIFNGLTGSISEDITAKALSKGKKIINISDEVYDDILPGSVYGLSKLYKGKVKNAAAVLNPSCYCAGAMLGLAPLMHSEFFNANSIVIESKSGITSLKDTDRLVDAEVSDDGGYKVYKLDNKQYSEEIKKQLEVLFGKRIVVSLNSYINGIKGIMTTIYADTAPSLDNGKASELYKKFYGDNPFVRVCEEGEFNNRTNNEIEASCIIELGCDKNTGKLVVTTVIRSIVRELTEQAVQTMNLMCGFDEKAGL